jgi:hypothetical protein
VGHASNVALLAMIRIIWERRDIQWLALYHLIVRFIWFLYDATNPFNFNLIFKALLVRELPSTATEESIELALFRYSGIPVKRIHIAPSRMYAFAQVKNPNDAAFMLESFHKMIPHIDNCAGFLTFRIIKLIRHIQ